MANRISEKEQQLFEILREDKLDDLRTFSKSSNRGMWKSIIDQYPESAHFIYELLQNANDAKATYAKIVINRQGVVFKHNGSIQFTITRLNAKPVGHINSITSIGDSSKDELNTIGKFGVGFKSVFSYTDTPEIYDDKFWFRINDYIVPALLDKDFGDRNKGETLFWLPFKSNEEEECYNAVASKVRKLDNPILFLDHIESIEWIDLVCNESSQYSKTIDKSRKIKNAQCELLCVNNSGEQSKIWMFHRNISIEGIKKPQRISVGYYIREKDGRDIIDVNVDPKLFCYFPTSETRGQKRIMHAPFLLTPSRSELREDHINDYLIKELAKLSADSLVYLRDIGLKQKSLLIDNNLFDFISFPKFGRGYVSYGTWDSEYLRVVKANNLLLTRAGKYASVADVVIVDKSQILNIFSDKQLTLLLGGSKPHYLICPHKQKYDDKWVYLTRTLGVSVFDHNRLARTITADFMRKQTDAWLHRFYDYLNNTNEWQLFKECPIIRTSNGDFVAPYQAGTLNVFMASTIVDSEKNIVDPLLIKKKKTKTFFETLGIRELKPIDQIDAIRVKYQGNKEISGEELYQDTHYVCTIFLSSKKAVQESIIGKLANKLIVSSIVRGNEVFANVSHTYDRSVDLDSYFKGNEEGYNTLNHKFYTPLFQEFDEDKVLHLLYGLGLKRHPIIAKKQTSINELSEQIQEEIKSHPSSYSYKIEEFEMHGLEYALSHNLTKEMSLQIWKWLSNATNDGVLWNKLIYRYYYYTNKEGALASSMLSLLTTSRWIYVADKPRNTPNKFTRQQMRDAGYCDNEKLFDILGVKRTYEDSILIPDEVKQLARIGEQFEGYTEEERAGFHDWVEKRRQLQSRQQLSEAELQDYLNSEDSYNYEDNVDKTRPRSSGSQTRAEEGKRRLRLHLQRERSSTIVNKFKQYKVQEDRDLRCEVCGFSFRETYGKLGVGYAEAHHIRPISERQESTETTFDDLCIVCANCHAMLHKTIFRKQISVENLKKLMKK